MSTFREMLAIGDLRSDGLADEIVRLVTATPRLLVELIEAFEAPEAAVRATPPMRSRSSRAETPNMWLLTCPD
jgi:hypothetical protein